MKGVKGWKGFVAGMAAFGLLGCAEMTGSQVMPLQISAAIPPAEGDVEYRKLDNGQTELEIEVKHLAPAGQAVEGATAYVAWLRPARDRSKVIKLGVLAVDDDREAELETTVGYQEFEVFITAEPNGQVTEPSGQQMMTASIGRIL